MPSQHPPPPPPKPLNNPNHTSFTTPLPPTPRPPHLHKRRIPPRKPLRIHLAIPTRPSLHTPHPTPLPPRPRRTMLLNNHHLILLPPTITRRHPPRRARHLRMRIPRPTHTPPPRLLNNHPIHLTPANRRHLLHDHRPATNTPPSPHLHRLLMPHPLTTPPPAACIHRRGALGDDRRRVVAAAAGRGVAHVDAGVEEPEEEHEAGDGAERDAGDGAGVGSRVQRAVVGGDGGGCFVGGELARVEGQFVGGDAEWEGWWWCSCARGVWRCGRHGACSLVVRVLRWVGRWCWSL